MRIDTLEDLYIEQLKGIYSANQQALDATNAMAAAATDEGLINALTAGAEGIQNGIAAMSEIAEGHHEDPHGKTCKGMEGLVAEARIHAVDAIFGEDATKDAMLITQYQLLVHYAIAGYGCLAAFADRLDLGDDVTKIKRCLDAAYDGDRTMTKLAAGGTNSNAIA